MYLVTSRVVPLVSANQLTGPGQPISASCGNPRAPDVVAEGIVVPHRHSGLKVGDRPDVCESVHTAEPGVRRRAHQFQQLGLLDGRRIHG